eukprot:1029902-Prorocentrum_minimum.AAC.8
MFPSSHPVNRLSQAVWMSFEGLELRAALGLLQGEEKDNSDSDDSDAAAAAALKGKQAFVSSLEEEHSDEELGEGVARVEGTKQGYVGCTIGERCFVCTGTPNVRCSNTNARQPITSVCFCPTIFSIVGISLREW